jgi:L-amino acid N-acyltransferase YncA
MSRDGSTCPQGADIPAGPNNFRMHTIRLAVLSDLPRLVEIYNQAIDSHTATADTIPFTVETRRGWFASHISNVYPIYACEDENGLVTGYLAVSPYRPRPALARTAEVSYYVDYTQHSRGIGSALMEYALQDARRIGKKVYLAFVLEMNTSSARLLEKFEFTRWGYLPNVAEFDGKLCGHFLFGRDV